MTTSQACSRPRIAVVLPDLRVGGAERLHVTLAREWLSAGIETDFVLREARGDLIRCLPEGSRVIDLGARRVRASLLPLMRYLRESPPDVLLAAMWPLTFIAPLAASLVRFRGRIVVSEHSLLSRAYAKKGRFHGLVLRATTNVGYRFAAARIGVSMGVAADMARVSGRPVGSFKVINNPAALGEAASSPDPLPIQHDASRPLILTVGTLKRVKRHDLLIDSFAEVAACSDAILCIVGEGTERTRLETQIARLNLSGRVFLPGHAADPSPWYAAARLFVLSSEYEGFGNVLVEAMEHGVPLVSTDCPSGPSEILGGGRFGTLVPVGDVRALSRAMIHALDAPQDPEPLRRRALDFSADLIARRYLEVMSIADQGDRP